MLMSMGVHAFANTYALLFMLPILDQCCKTLMLAIIAEEFAVNSVKVTVKWSQQMGAVYHVKMMPLAHTEFAGSTSRRLIIQYNTEYNFSVVAVTFCGNATSFIGLHYGQDNKRDVRTCYNHYNVPITIII